MNKLATQMVLENKIHSHKYQIARKRDTFQECQKYLFSFFN